MFGKSFDEKVKAALEEMRGLNIKALDARIDGRDVTLTGEAPDKAAKARAMEVFNSMVETENTINMIRIGGSAPGPGAAPSPVTPPPTTTTDAGTGAEEALPRTMRVHVVSEGETLSAIAKRYYGKASRYPEIFEANRDLLEDPDRILPGQRLRIP